MASYYDLMSYSGRTYLDELIKIAKELNMELPKYYIRPDQLCVLGSMMSGKTGLRKRFAPSDVVNVEFYPPAVKMFFKDGTVTVATPHGDDEYDPEMGMTMCIFKYIWGDKSYNNFFRKWIKKDEEAKKAKSEAEKAAKEAKELEARKKAKNDARKKKRAEAKKEYEISVMAEAMRRANECKDSCDCKKEQSE